MLVVSNNSMDNRRHSSTSKGRREFSVILDPHQPTDNLRLVTPTITNGLQDSRTVEVTAGATLRVSLAPRLPIRTRTKDRVSRELQTEEVMAITRRTTMARSVEATTTTVAVEAVVATVEETRVAMLLLLLQLLQLLLQQKDRRPLLPPSHLHQQQHLHQHPRLRPKVRFSSCDFDLGKETIDRTSAATAITMSIEKCVLF
jgi:hypothetical protein